ncbi:MAG: EGF-like domain, partial [Pseudomonadota bacterium]
MFLLVSAVLVVLSSCAAEPGDDTQAPSSEDADEQASIFIPECSPNPCLNGGTCAETLLGFACSCIGGFSGARCDVAPGGPPVAQPPVFPPLFPTAHTLAFNVQQTFDGIVPAAGDITSVTVTVNGATCAPGACTAAVPAGGSATVVVRLAVRAGGVRPLPVLRSWGDCATTNSSFTHVVNPDQTSTVAWTSTFSNLSADRTCTANFAKAASFWFHLPFNGPSVAKAEPAQFCDFVVNPI